MTFASLFDWLPSRRYMRYLEADNARLRGENQRLLNAVLKRAGYVVDNERREPPAASVPVSQPRPQGPLPLNKLMRLPTEAIEQVEQAVQKPQHRGRGVAAFNQSLRERERIAAKEAAELREKLQGQIESYEKIAVEKAKGVSA
jgi:hypothetical protein